MLRLERQGGVSGLSRTLQFAPSQQLLRACKMSFELTPMEFAPLGLGFRGGNTMEKLRVFDGSEFVGFLEQHRRFFGPVFREGSFDPDQQRGDFLLPAVLFGLTLTSFFVLPLSLCGFSLLLDPPLGLELRALLRFLFLPFSLGVLPTTFLLFCDCDTQLSERRRHQWVPRRVAIEQSDCRVSVSIRQKLARRLHSLCRKTITRFPPSSFLRRSSEVRNLVAQRGNPFILETDPGGLFHPLERSCQILTGNKRLDRSDGTLERLALSFELTFLADGVFDGNSERSRSWCLVLGRYGLEHNQRLIEPSFLECHARLRDDRSMGRRALQLADFAERVRHRHPDRIGRRPHGVDRIRRFVELSIAG